MTTALTIIIILVIAIGGFLAYASMRPNTFRIERAIVINATPERILPFLADFHQWAAWSPWERKDPAMKRTFSGAPSGVGAIYAWEGNKNVGSGSMEILEATPARVRVKLDFMKPFEAHNTAIFTLEPQGASTRVNWAMEGPVPLMMKAMHAVMDMDKMVGKDFEAGLANLKAAAEA